MTTVEKGNITELEVQLELVKKGLLVFSPVNDGCFVDLIVKLPSGYKSLQIKSARQTSTGFTINLYSTCGGFKKKLYSCEHLDLFATFFNGRIYLIPVKDVEGMTKVTLRFSDKYRNQNKPFMAVDYEV